MMPAAALIAIVPLCLAIGAFAANEIRNRNERREWERKKQCDRIWKIEDRLASLEFKMGDRS